MRDKQFALSEKEREMRAKEAELKVKEKELAEKNAGIKTVFGVALRSAPPKTSSSPGGSVVLVDPDVPTTNSNAPKDVPIQSGTGAGKKPPLNPYENL